MHRTMVFKQRLTSLYRKHTPAEEVPCYFISSAEECAWLRVRSHVCLTLVSCLAALALACSVTELFFLLIKFEDLQQTFLVCAISINN